jgi:hypothetical protein
LRHLFATRYIEGGVNIPTVSRWLNSTMFAADANVQCRKKRRNDQWSGQRRAAEFRRRPVTRLIDFSDFGSEAARSTTRLRAKLLRQGVTFANAIAEAVLRLKKLI